MRSPTYALVWEIWQRNRLEVAAITGLTVVGRLLDVSDAASSESSPVVNLLAMCSFVLLFGIFNYTDSSGSRGLGRFPERLFLLPVSSLRLVTLPVVTGIAAVELLYLLWLGPLSRGGSTSPMFVGALFAALMVCYQAALWTLDRLGALRLVVIGALAFAIFSVGILPSFPPTPPPLWRSESTLTALVSGLAVIAFLIAWRYIVGLRCGERRRAIQLEGVITAAAHVFPAKQKPFASPTAAHFWFEWRCSGRALPVLVGGVLVVVVAPLTWFVRDDGGASLRLLAGTLAMPIVLAIPVGMAFAKPTFWSEDVSLPPFVAVRPLSNEDLVAIKVRVAVASVAAAWLLVLSFLVVWLSLWANLDSLSQFAMQLWAFHGHSVAAVYAIGALVAIAGMFLTWRFLVCRLWSGLSGRRPLFVASVLSVVVAIAAGVAFDVAEMPQWLLGDPARMTAVVWVASFAVTLKYWLAAYSWRRVSAHYARQYLLIWGAGTACLLMLGILLWGVVRIYVAMDIYRFQALMILVALLALPLGRLGFAPNSLAHNRHR